MQIQNMTFNLEHVSGKNQNVMLTGVRQLQEYTDGKPTGKFIGHTYTCILPDGKPKYASIPVKILGKKPVMTQDEIDNAEGEIFVELENFIGRFYRDGNGVYQFTSTADAIHVVS